MSLLDNSRNYIGSSRVHYPKEIEFRALCTNEVIWVVLGSIVILGVREKRKHFLTCVMEQQ